jgi:hypothetical protein
MLSVLRSSADTLDLGPPRTLPEMGEIFILTWAAHLYLQAFVNFASHLLGFQWFYGSMGV